MPERHKNPESYSLDVSRHWILGGWLVYAVLTTACVFEPPTADTSSPNKNTVPAEAGKAPSRSNPVTARAEDDERARDTTDGPTRSFVLAHQPGAMPEIGTNATRADAEKKLAHLPPRLGLGRPARTEEIAAWDIDIMPDGAGLPEGRGTAQAGAIIYKQQCESCHGIEADGGRYEALAGREPREGFPFGDDPSLRYTVGNYWPYATTLFDYTRRAMPQAVPGSLSADQVYSLVAYLLYLNELWPQDASLDAESLKAIEMPARDRFVVDDRRGGTELR